MRRPLLVSVSAAQLACNVTGMAVALKRGHAYDLGFLRSDPRRIARDSLVMGTALSAPVGMLCVHAAATVGAASGSERAANVIGVLGAGNALGYVGERLVRLRLRRSGADPVETPLVAAGLGLALTAAFLGLGGSAGASRGLPQESTSRGTAS